jgi:O-antigen ligase
LSVTLENWLTNPVLGNGTGDTAYQLGGPNFEGYPHNLLLEAANELGVIGLVCMLVVFGYGIRMGFGLSRPELEGTYAKAVTVPFFGCFLHHLLFSFKTGGYAGSYTFYFFLGCTIALSRLWQAERTQLQRFSDESWLGRHSPAGLPPATGGYSQTGAARGMGVMPR